MEQGIQDQRQEIQRLKDRLRKTEARLLEAEAAVIRAEHVREQNETLLRCVRTLKAELDLGKRSGLATLQ